MTVVYRRIVNWRLLGRCVVMVDVVVVVDGTSMVRIRNSRGRGIEAHKCRPLYISVARSSPLTCSSWAPSVQRGGLAWYAELMQC